MPVALTTLDFVSGGGSQLMTLLFDKMELNAAKQARNMAERLLKMPESAKTDFAVFKIANRLELYQNTTRNRALLVQAIRDTSEPLAIEKALFAEAESGADAGGKMLSAANRQEAKAMASALIDSEQLIHQQHVPPSLSGLMALLRAEQKISGRKAIVYFASSLQVDTSARELVRTVIGLANRADVSLYVLSPNSLDNSTSNALLATMAVGSQTAAGQTGITSAAPVGLPSTFPVEGAGAGTMGSEQVGRIETSALDKKDSPMADLCISTAGRYLGDGADLKYRLRQMFTDLDSYYRASYVAPAMQYDGQFRPVQVRPVPKGLRVQARTGYLALPSTAPVGTRPFEVALQKVLDQPLLPTGIDFRSSVMHIGESATTNVFVVEIPFRDLVFAEDQNTRLFSLHVSMLSQIRDTTGTVIESFSEDLPRRGAQETKDRMRGETATIERHFNAPPGEYTLEVGVQDGNVGKASAQRYHFRIADEPEGGHLSDIALVRRVEAFRTESEMGDPLQYKGNRVVPRIASVFGRDEQEISVFFVIHPDEKSTAQPKLEMEIRKDSEIVGRGELALRQIEPGKPVAYMAGLKASPFGPGVYQAAVILTHNGNKVESLRDFEIPGEQMASTAAPVMTRTHTALTIAPATSAVTRPNDELLSSLISAAKQRAIEYTDSLPNVTCVEVTERSVDASGAGAFQHQDTITELVRYYDKTEKRAMVAVNNRPSEADRATLKGTISHGEFGGLLTSIFDTKSNAQFSWKETDVIGSDLVQVFSYSVAPKESTLGISAANGDYFKPGFHGVVYVDEFTHAVRRLTLESDELPAQFPTHSVRFTVDSGYIAIGEHDYLLPITGSVRVAKGKRMVVLNEFDFRDYKRYLADSTVQY